MSPGWLQAGDLLGGPLRSNSPWPFTFDARLCDLRPRFLVKKAVGRGGRAVSRNGRILLCSDRPLEALADQVVRVRLQTWHRAILPGDAPQPYGVLLCVRCPVEGGAGPLFTTRLTTRALAAGDLEVDVGGGLVLELKVARSRSERDPTRGASRLP
jgi:hypothetical protein